MNKLVFEDPEVPYNDQIPKLNILLLLPHHNSGSSGRAALI